MRSEKHCKEVLSASKLELRDIFVQLIIIITLTYFFSLIALHMASSPGCFGQYLEISDYPNNRLARLCGIIENSPPIFSTTNTMKMTLYRGWNAFKSFKSTIKFAYGKNPILLPFDKIPILPLLVELWHVSQLSRGRLSILTLSASLWNPQKVMGPIAMKSIIVVIKLLLVWV